VQDEAPHELTLELLAQTPRHEWYDALHVIPHDVPTQMAVPFGSVGHDATTSCQVPVEEQVCGRVGPDAHCVAPGPHTPLHTPLTQVLLVHATAVPHWPLDPQVCTPLPEHCVAPGPHGTQLPLRHTGLPPVQATGLPNCPLALHVSTPPPAPPSTPPSPDAAQVVAPGVQTPVHAPPLQT
jgi:hypothetical protein